jgi:hypothetical protein
LIWLGSVRVFDMIRKTGRLVFPATISSLSLPDAVALIVTDGESFPMSTLPEISADPPVGGGMSFRSETFSPYFWNSFWS